MAQNMVLSQPYVNAQFQSAALVGDGQYDQRIQSNLRTQMFNNNNVSSTIVAGWDSRFKSKDAENNSSFGYGFQIMSDQLAGGLLQTNYLTMNLAYRIFVDEGKNNSIALGLAGTYAQSTLNQSKLKLGDQLNSQMNNLSSAGFPVSDLYFNKFPASLTANTGFVFNEGLLHETQYTEYVPRLLLGPMNEFAQPVGFPLTYFSNEADALSYSNPLGYGNFYIVGDGGPFGGYTSWRLASNSSGTSSKSIVYSNGDALNADGSYYLYPSAPCFLEGSTILCHIDGVEQYIPVEQLKNGTLVKTSLDGYKKVVLLGKGSLLNPGNDERTENRLYKCSSSKYPSLKDDLYITGCHSILEFPITEKQTEDTIKHLGKLFVTDKKYRLMACVDERAEPWNAEGTYTIWHFALEHYDEGMNYGVYANGGLLVETCCIKMLKNKSNMTLFTE